MPESQIASERVRDIELLPADIRSCGSCGARIVWAFTASGKKMPVDVRPTSDGTVLLIRRARKIEAQTFTKQDLESAKDGVEFRKSHFATCPHASGHRR